MNVEDQASIYMLSKKKKDAQNGKPPLHKESGEAVMSMVWEIDAPGLPRVYPNSVRSMDDWPIGVAYSSPGPLS
jgi:hypothetical protein